MPAYPTGIRKCTVEFVRFADRVFHHWWHWRSRQGSRRNHLLRGGRTKRWGGRCNQRLSYELRTGTLHRYRSDDRQLSIIRGNDGQGHWQRVALPVRTWLCNCDGDDSYSNAGTCHRPVEMNLVSRTVGRDELTEGDETGSDSNNSKKHQRKSHS